MSEMDRNVPLEDVPRVVAWWCRRRGLPPDWEGIEDLIQEGYAAALAHRGSMRAIFGACRDFARTEYRRTATFTELGLTDEDALVAAAAVF